jgi:predicted nucleotidyltransferase
MTNVPTLQALYVTKVGSTLYGTATPMSDIDFKGFCLPTATQLVGMDTFEQQSYDNQVEDGPDKMEGQVYALKKFMHLAVVKANPTILEVCFADPKFHIHSTPLGLEVADFIQKNAVTKTLFKPYNAYHRAQMRKMQSQERTGKRVAIVEEFGYDVKFAMHAYRLGRQAVLAMSTGKVVPTLVGEDLTMANRIRQGEFSIEECLEILQKVDDDMYAAYQASTIPTSPNYKLCNDYLTDVHKRFLAGEFDSQIMEWKPW